MKGLFRKCFLIVGTINIIFGLYLFGMVLLLCGYSPENSVGAFFYSLIILFPLVVYLKDGHKNIPLIKFHSTEAHRQIETTEGDILFFRIFGPFLLFILELVCLFYLVRAIYQLGWGQGQLCQIISLFSSLK